MTSPLRYLGGSSSSMMGSAAKSPHYDPTDSTVEDLLQGMNEWNNIQEVFRTTIKAIHDVVKAQGQALHSLESQMAEKASKSEVNTLLAKKASIADVNHSLSQMTKILDTKADLQDLEAKADWKAIENALESKVSEAEFNTFKDSVVPSRDYFYFKEHCDSQFRLISNNLNDKMDASSCKTLLESKANSADTAAAIQRKVSREELEEMMRAHVKAEQTNRKTDEKAIDDLRLQMQRLASKNDVGETIAVLNDKVDRSEMDAVVLKTSEKFMDALEISLSKLEAAEKRKISSLEDRIEGLDREFSLKLSQNDKELSSRISNIDVKQAQRTEDTATEIEEKLSRVHKTLSTQIVQEKQRLESRFEQLRDEIDKILNSSLQHTEEMLQQSVRRDDFLVTMAKKANDTDVYEIKEAIGQIEEELARMQHDADILNKSSDNLDAQTEKNSSAIVSARRSIEDLSSQISSLSKNFGSLSSQFDICETKFASQDTRISACDEKIQANNIRLASLQQMSDNKVADVQRELLLKADIKDMNAILDTKANIDDVNRSLMQVNATLESRATVRQLEAFVEEQAIINSSLGDASLGRWIWQSGITKASNCVPWNVQSINTDPENLLWDRDKINIVVRDPGLYEVSFGFFSRKKPVVQLMVNGEPVFMISNQQSISGSARLTPSQRHSAGNVAGLTHVDFVALPAKAKVALTYACESRAEGFLSIRKL